MSVSTHSVKHFTETEGAPAFSCPSHLPQEKLKVAKAEFNHMLETNHSPYSAWASPLHIALKHSGDLHPIEDFRCVNPITLPDQHPILHIQDVASSLHSCTIFSKLDLVKYYHQIPVNPTDIPKTVMTTPFGAFEFLTMPFRLWNTANNFQHFIDEVVVILALYASILLMFWLCVFHLKNMSLTSIYFLSNLSSIKFTFSPQSMFLVCLHLSFWTTSVLLTEYHHFQIR